MIKQKLISKRKERGLSQSEMAHFLNIEQSQYSRRENGHTNVSIEEWNKISKILKCEVQDIFESSESIYISNNTTTNGSIGFNNIYKNNSDFIIESLRKYIKKLENEVADLTNKIKR